MHFKWGLYIPSKFTFTKCVSNTVFDEAILLFSMNMQPTKAVLRIRNGQFFFIKHFKLDQG